VREGERDSIRGEAARKETTMMLLTKENRAALPALYSQESKGMDAIIHVKFFGGGRWTWYATEFDGEDTFFGYTVSGLGSDCDELGYFSLSELMTLRFPPFGLPIERDRHFKSRPLSEVVA
jgi:hypothetical protein